MPGRLLDVPPALPKTFGTLSLTSPPNWTAVWFLGALGLLHLTIAISGFLNLRWEAYMSALLGVAFVVAAFVFFRIRQSIAFDRAHRLIQLKTGLGPFFFQRRISFDDVHAVRLTMSRSDRPRTRIEVLCDNEDIECPPTDAPGREALCLAVLLNVQLIKVWSGEDISDHTPRI